MNLAVLTITDYTATIEVCGDEEQYIPVASRDFEREPVWVSTSNDPALDNEVMLRDIDGRKDRLQLLRDMSVAWANDLGYIIENINDELN
jgi:hypothetical protein